MLEPPHQTVDRDFPDRGSFEGRDRVKSGLQDLEQARPGKIKPTIGTGIEADDWLVSLLAPVDDGSIWPGCNAATLRPGMTVKIIYHEAIRRDVRLSSMARELGLSRANALIRTTSTWMPNMLISGKRLAILAVDSTDLSAGTITFEHPPLISTLTTIFDQAWNTAAPLASIREHQSGVNARELQEGERNLLKLLAVGMTDETVARQLGISLRTTRRHIAALMSHLAASSRFQAGAEAAKRGWLS